MIIVQDRLVIQIKISCYFRLMTLALLAVVTPSIQESAVFKSPKSFLPCLAIEAGGAVHTAKPSRPFLIQLNFEVFSKQIYNEIFGANATETKEHSRNYACAEKFGEYVKKIVDRFIARIKSLLETRSQAFEAEATSASSGAFVK